VNFNVGGVLLGSGTLNVAGVASFTTSMLGAGTDLVNAVYLGNTSYTTATSSNVTLNVLADATSTLLSAMPNPVSTGQSVTFTATVAPTLSTVLPGGVVTFLDGGSGIGSGTPGSNGTVSLSTSTLTPGQHTITAVYAGNTNFIGSSSAGLSLEVTPPTYSLSAFPTVMTVAQGQATAISTISITSVGGFTGTFTFACGNVPQNAICEFTPQTLTITSNGTSTTDFVLQTSGYAWTDPFKSGMPWLPAVLLAGWLAVQRRRGKRMSSLLIVLLLASCLGGAMGCSSRQAVFTPAGTYTVPVTVSTLGSTQTLEYTIAVVPLQ
jgi:hypothetical protein